MLQPYTDEPDRPKFFKFAEAEAEVPNGFFLAGERGNCSSPTGMSDFFGAGIVGSTDSEPVRVILGVYMVCSGHMRGEFLFTMLA